MCELWPAWLRWLGVVPCTKRLSVHFLVRASTQALGSISGSEYVGSLRIRFRFDVSLSFCIPLSLKINRKYFTKKEIFGWTMNPLHSIGKL